MLLATTSWLELELAVGCWLLFGIRFGVAIVSGLGMSSPANDSRASVARWEFSNTFLACGVPNHSDDASGFTRLLAWRVRSIDRYIVVARPFIVITLFFVSTDRVPLLLLL